MDKPATGGDELRTETLLQFLHRQPQRAQAKDPVSTDYDVVIVGSGYGGSMAAHVLAAAGKPGDKKLRVLLLERGKRFEPRQTRTHEDGTVEELRRGAFPYTFSELARELRIARQETGEVSGHEGLFDLRPGPDVNVLVANGVGGGSLINAGVMLEPDPKDVRSPTLAERIDALKRNHTYRRARRMLGGEVLRPVPGQQRWVHNNADRLPAPLRKLAAFRDVAGARQAQVQPVDITMSLDDGLNYAKNRLARCTGCGDCMTGCNVGAKDSLDRNLLLRAQRSQKAVLDIVTGATVTSLTPVRGDVQAWRLRVVHTDARLQAREDGVFHIRTPRVVLAAGTLGSTEILLRSRDEHLSLSPTLGEGFSGNGDDVAAVHRLPLPVHSTGNEDLDPTDASLRQVGPTTTGCVELRMAADKDKGGKPVGPPPRPFLVEEFSVPGPMRRLFHEAVAMGWALARMPQRDRDVHRGSDLDPMAIDADAMERTLLVGVIGHDSAGGSLRLPLPTRPDGGVPQMGALTIHWPDARWGAEMDAAHDRLKAFAEDEDAPQPAGERTCLVSNPVWRLLPRGMDTLVTQPRGPLMTVHPLGGCRMGANVDEGVVDHCGRVFDTQGGLHAGLVVLDGSIVGASLGVNPALTIAALALAAMEELLTIDWTDFNPAAADPELKPDDDALPAQKHPAPAYPPLAPPRRAPRHTVIQVKERIWGPIRLDARDWIVELTMSYRPTPIATLIAPERRRVRLIEADSHLRLYSADEWRTHHLQHRDDDERDDFVRYQAALRGDLRFLHHDVTQPWSRVWRGLRAWLCNRGLRDAYQRYWAPWFIQDAKDRKRAENNARPDSDKPHLRRELCEFFALASHAAQGRLFDYTLRLGAARALPRGDARLQALLSAGAPIRGHKRLSYDRRRVNPWHQLTRLHLDTFPGVQPSSGDEPLELDLRYLAKTGTPLLTVYRQRDHAEALAELTSFGLYLVRVLIEVHLWSFRRPDRPPAREPDRLPPSLPPLPAPQITWLTVGKWPRDTPLEGQPLRVRLTRYPLPGRRTGAKPLVMIHGYSASGTTFAHPSLKPSAASYFWARGRDVWVLDLRTSCGLDSALHPWAMEQPALIDIPAALLHVRNVTGQRVDVLAHCIGASMLAMALLTTSDEIAQASVQLGVDTWLTSEHLGTLDAFNRRVGPKAQHPSVDRVVLSQKGPVMRYTNANVLRAYVMQYVRRFLIGERYVFRPNRDPGLMEQLVDRLLSSLPYPDADFDRENPRWPSATTPWTATRHRLDALFGRAFSAAGLRDETLKAIDDFFGPLNLDTVAQTIHFARWDAITNQRGRGEFVTRQRVRERWAGISTLAVHGEDNGLVDPFTLELVKQTLGAAGVPFERYESATGHQDALIGTGAEDVFKCIEGFLCNEAVAASAAPPPPPTCIAAPPWIGPRLVRASATRGVQVAVMTRPDQGKARLWLVPATRQHDAAGKVSLTLSDGSWIGGDEGDNDGWLRAGVAAGVATATAGDPGWLALMIYDLSQTTARPAVGSRSSSSASRGAAASIAPVPAPAPVFVLPSNAFSGGARLPEPGVALNMPVALSAAAVAALVPPGPYQPGAGPSDDEVEAVSTWYSRQSPAALCEVFVGAADVQRSAELEAWPADKPFRFALGSCQYPYGLFDRLPAGASLKALAALDGDDAPALALFVGDQIYADATAGLIDPSRRDERYELPHQRALHAEPMRAVMRRMPVEMLLDDHELFDNWQPLPGDLPSDEDNRRLKALRKSIRNAARDGIAAFRRFQRVESKPQAPAPAPSLDLQFQAGGHAFYLLDTRTQRQRGRPSDPSEGTIMSSAQRQALRQWLLDQPARCVKFIAAPSLFLPRRRESVARPDNANAQRSDAFDGFPASMRWLLQFIDTMKMQRIVLLSGDEHHSLYSVTEVGKHGIRLVTVHASALYAPYPFANGRPRDLMEEEGPTMFGVAASVRTTRAPPGDGFAVIGVAGDDLTITFHRAGQRPQPGSVRL